MFRRELDLSPPDLEYSALTNGLASRLRLSGSWQAPLQYALPGLFSVLLGGVRVTGELVAASNYHIPRSEIAIQHRCAICLDSV
jgi:hypothetical protein